MCGSLCVKYYFISHHYFYKSNSKSIKLMKTMFHPVDQFTESPAGTKKKELENIIKHDQMKQQVAIAFLNENLKRGHENDIPPIQENTKLRTFNYNHNPVEHRSIVC